MDLQNWIIQDALPEMASQFQGLLKYPASRYEFSQIDSLKFDERNDDA